MKAAVVAEAPEDDAFPRLIDAYARAEVEIKAAVRQRDQDARVLAARLALEDAQRALDEAEKPYRSNIEEATAKQRAVRDELPRVWPEPDQSQITGKGPHGAWSVTRRVLTSVIVDDHLQALDALRRLDDALPQNNGKFRERAIKSVTWDTRALRDALKLVALPAVRTETRASVAISLKEQ